MNKINELMNWKKEMEKKFAEHSTLLQKVANKVGVDDRPEEIKPHMVDGILGGEPLSRTLHNNTGELDEHNEDVHSSGTVRREDGSISHHHDVAREEGVIHHEKVHHDADEELVVGTDNPQAVDRRVAPVETQEPGGKVPPPIASPYGSSSGSAGVPEDVEAIKVEHDEPSGDEHHHDEHDVEQKKE